MPEASTPLTTDNRSRTNQEAGACPSCSELIATMNSTFQAVHDYIIANRDQRSVNESYLGELGRLIQAQIAAYRALAHHQRQHHAA
jgi:hypothetical protein